MPPAAGRCEEGTPCEQGCFNLHDFMYECYCHQGFYLHSNGYNCIGEKMDCYKLLYCIQGVYFAQCKKSQMRLGFSKIFPPVDYCHPLS